MPQNRYGGQQTGAPPRGGQGPGREHRQEHTLEQMWSGYLKQGYFEDDEKRILRKELVSRAKVEALVKEMAREAEPNLNNNQLRRFFQHARVVEAKIRSKPCSWEKLLAEVLKLDVAAADALGKSPPKIPKLFHDFIKRNIETIKDERDFILGFMPHFEALVGFGSQFVKDRTERS